MSEELTNKEIDEREGCVYAFMDLVDWECEAGFNDSGNHIFYSVDDLMLNRPCVKNCGIVKVKIEFVETIQEGTI